MAAHRANFLNSYRKRYFFSQSDVAFLIDGSGKGQVSRYEKDGVIPSLQTALALQIIFGVPLEELFPNLYESVEHLVEMRLRELIGNLHEQLPEKGPSVTAKKLLWLEQHPILSKSTQNTTTTQ